jgi:hypothetical protein
MAYRNCEKAGTQQGHTLIEVTISAALILSLIAVAMVVATESMSMAAFQEADYRVQHESNRAFRRLAEVIRKSGWNTDAGVTYPLVGAGGTELSFRLVRDLDGNGYPFDAATGELEWGAMVHTVRLDNQMLVVMDTNDEILMVLGRDIQAVSFATFLQDNSLHLNEVQVVIQAQRSSPQGDPIEFTARGSIHLRN